MRTALEIVLTAGEENVLTRLSRSNTSSVRQDCVVGVAGQG
jgi:hypothetical protein